MICVNFGLNTLNNRLINMIDLWTEEKCHYHTVNVVIFAGGKFRENVGKAFHVGVIFTILLIFPS